MDEQNLLWAGLALCLSIITYLSLSQHQKEIIVSRLNFRGRRASSANTPPRSLSPDKKEPTNAPLKSSEYVTAFPPIQRDHLEKVAAALPEKQRMAMGDLSFDEDTFSDNLLRFDEDYRKADDDKYVYTGHSVKEIKALGDFPDYETLSGVPNPQPYREHDIDKAIPRPYRPFRWAYHQTMCKLKRLSINSIY